MVVGLLPLAPRSVARGAPARPPRLIEWCRGIVEWHHGGLITHRSVVRIGLPQQRRGPQGPRSSFLGVLLPPPRLSGKDEGVAYKDPERQKAYALEWLKRYPEKARAAAKRWNHANPEKRREQQRRQRERDPAKYNAK